MDQVHFHDSGATDAIVDIVGTCLGLNYLKVDTVLCSPASHRAGQGVHGPRLVASASPGGAQADGNDPGAPL